MRRSGFRAMWVLFLFIVAPKPCGSAAGARPQCSLEFGPAGLKSLKVDGTEFLADGRGRVDGISWVGKDGKTVRKPPGEPSLQVDPEERRVSWTYPWGSVRFEYLPRGNRLTLKVGVKNASAEILDGLELTLLTLRLPAKAREYDEVTPMMATNVGGPSLLPLSGSGFRLVAANEDLERPLYLGFPWAVDRPHSLTFPLWADTRLRDMLPRSYPPVRRPIAPGGSEEFVVSLRWGAPEVALDDLTGDLYQRYREGHPAILRWDDRRPIGYLMLSTSATHWPTNPRGWLQDPSVDVTTETGRQAFRKRMLDYAEGSVKILHEMGAQGAIVWDVEGQEFPHAVSYLGDPRRLAELAPEIDPIADEFFSRLKEAKLRTGICIRPTRIVPHPQQPPPPGATRFIHQSVPDIEGELAAKIEYARRRWGCSLFYIDSNVLSSDSTAWILPAELMENLAKKFPDSLLMPEHANVRYWSCTAPYRELRQGHASTPHPVRAVYPGSFTVINTADGLLDDRRRDLVEAVNGGDILLFRAWWNDPGNRRVKEILDEARR